MSIYLRQIALVATKLAPAVDDLTAIFGIAPCYVDPGVGLWGLENTLMPVGSNFLEVVAPTKGGTSAGRYLARRGGDGGYMVICQTESRESQRVFRDRAVDAGVRVAYEGDREGFRIMQLHPGDLEAAFLEIDWDIESDFAGRWEPAGGTDWKRHVRTERVRAITGAELQCTDPAALAAKWAHVVNLPVRSIDGTPGVQLANASLRFIQAADARGPGLGGVELVVNDRDAILREARRRGCPTGDNHVIVCGTRFYLR
ncbi:MAG: VOC family protein [Burkholderiales bacterium]